MCRTLRTPARRYSPFTTYTGTNQPRTIGLIFRQEF